MSGTLLLAIAVSATLILLLGLGDPKRRRSTGTVAGAHGTRMRRLLAAGACSPGVALAITGDAAAFLIWLGASSVIGWFLALVFGAVSGQLASAQVAVGRQFDKRK